MRTLIAGLCCFTIAASCWLATMSIVLHRPGYQGQVGFALLFVAQGLLTLGVLAGILPGTSSRGSTWSAGTRVVLGLGAVGLAVIGGRAIAANLSGRHFEGYAVVIGISLMLQGVLTLWPLCVGWPQSLSKNALIW